MRFCSVILIIFITCKVSESLLEEKEYDNKHFSDGSFNNNCNTSLLNLTISQNITEIDVTWDSVSTSEKCGFEYRINITQKSPTDLDMLNLSEEVNTTFYHMTDVKPCTEYHFSVEAFQRNNSHALVSLRDTYNSTITLSTVNILNKTATNHSIWFSLESDEYIDRCNIQYRINKTSVSLIKEIPYVRYQNNTEHEIPNLQSCTSFNISITQSSNFQFNSENDEPLVFTLNTLPDKVDNLSLKIFGDNSTISWKPPINQDCIKGYKISTENSSEVTNNTFIVINKTLYCTEVEVAALATNNQPGTAVFIQTLGKVEKLEVKTTETSLIVTWEPPKDPSCVGSYFIKLMKMDEEINSNVTDILSYTFENLESCSSYTVMVAAISKDDVYGDYDSTSDKTLEPNEIEEVRNFEIIPQTEDTLTVKWEPPLNAKACDITYVLQVHDKEISESATSYEIDIRSYIGCKEYIISVKATTESSEGKPYHQSKQIPKVPNPPECKWKNIDKTWALLECSTDPYSKNMCKITELFVNCEAPKSKNDGSWIIWNMNYTEPIEDNKNRPSIETNVSDISEYTNYVCDVTVINSAGKSLKSKPIIFQTNEEVPDPPTTIKIVYITSTSFTISWDEPEKLPGPLEEYRVNIISKRASYFIPDECSQEKEKHIKETVLPSQNYFDFIHALPMFVYEIYVEAKNIAGYSSPSSVERITTRGGVPDEPRDIDFHTIVFDQNIYNVSVYINWSYPCKANDMIKHFEAEIVGTPLIDLDSDEYHDIQKPLVNDPIEDLNYECTFENLEPAYKYVIKFKSVTENDLPSNPAELNFISPDGLPEAPIIKPISEVTKDTFLVEWDEPKRKNGKLLNYLVHVLSLGPVDWIPDDCTKHFLNETYEVLPEYTSFKFVNGVSNHNYKVQVVANTSVGFGEKSAEMLTKTIEEREPEKVRNLEAKIILETTEQYNATAEISFLHPCRTYGDVKQFTLCIKGSRSNYSQHIDEIKITDNLQQTKYTVSLTLFPEYEYLVTVQVETDKYKSELAETKFTSPAGVPPGLIRNITPPIPYETNQAAFTFSNDIFNETYGNILYYSLIIGVLNYQEESTFNFWNGTDETWPEVGEKVRNDNEVLRLQPYEATPKFWNPFKECPLNNFTVILGDTSLSESNALLQMKIIYTFKVRGFTSHGYRDSPTVTFQLPEEKLINLALILGLLFGILGTGIILGLMFILWRRRQQWVMKKESIKSIPLTPIPVSIKQFPDYCDEFKDNRDKLKQEYTLLGNKSNEVILPSYDGLLPENKKKNRYTNIIPYDQTRVKLVDTNDNYTFNDYINASYIQGYSGTMEYIATQGPLEHTCLDFWKMVIQENVSLIVMVAQFVEQNKEKCFKYFPDNHENMELENGIEIRCCTELNFKFYTVRTFLVQKDLQQWTVTHLQFTDWPDFGCPTGTEVMLEFCQLMRQYAEQNSDPIIIHCSAGVGRTGTLVALDILLQTINNQRDIDVFGTVLNLRRDRKNMVQTEKQYLYIHSCIRDAIENPPSLKNGEVIKDPIYENLEDIKKKNDDIIESQF